MGIAAWVHTNGREREHATKQPGAGSHCETGSISCMRSKRELLDCWLEVTEPSATNLACTCKINLWGVVWRGGLLDLASESHRVIRVGT